MLIGRVPTNQSCEAKYGWSRHIATTSRPVAARASRSAALVASEAFLQNFTMSAPGTTAEEVLRGGQLELASGG